MLTVELAYDIVIVGGGHAGCEAARACARLGMRTAMITMNADLIAQMSCNPAIGGIAKGHLVREIDALGGVMGEVTDAVGIQFRLLNTSRGPAVWSPRAQCDKKQYRIRMKEVLEREPNLHIKQAEVAALIIEDGRALRRSSDGWAEDPMRRDYHHHRYVPQGLGPYRRAAVQLRAEWRAAVRSARGADSEPRSGMDPAEDRDSAAARFADRSTGRSSSRSSATRSRFRSPSSPQRSTGRKSSVIWRAQLPRPHG